MNTALRSRLAAAALPLAAAAALLSFAPLAPASAAVDDYAATYAGPGNGLNDVVPDANNKWWPAGSERLKLPSGAELEVFCIQFTNFNVEKSGGYRPQTWPAAGLSAAQLAKATDIASRHRNIGTPFDKASWEKAAVQTAVWKVTNDVDYKKIKSKEFKERVKQLMDGSSAANDPMPLFDFAIKADKTTRADGADVVSATLTAHGLPAPNKWITFTVDGAGQNVQTDSSGAASIVLPQSTSARQVSMTYTGRSGRGVVFVPTSGKQAMIAAEGFDVSASAGLSVAAFVPETVTPTPTPTPPSNPTPVAEPTDEPDPVSVPTPPAPQPEPTTVGEPAPPVATPTTVVDPGPKKNKDKEKKVEVAKDPVPPSFPKTGAFSLVGGLLAAGALGAAGLWGMRRYR